METKVCSKCGRELPVSDFYKNKVAKDGLSSYCKKCNNALSAESNRKRRAEKKSQSGGQR